MKYVLKKAGAFLLTILIVSFLVFVAFALIPGDAAVSRLGTQATPEQLEALREEMGLNQPLPVRYGQWLSGLFRGDMGTSYSYQMPVRSMVADKLPITLTLTGMAFVMVVLLSIPFGIYAAKHEGGPADRMIMVISQITMAIPPFFLGILLTFFFGLVLRWFTPGGYVSYQTDWMGFVSYLFFPALAIALPKSAMAMKLLRSSVLKEKEFDYVRTAYSRGNSTNQVLYGHVLKNALIPVITFLGMTLADMIAGSIIIEQVFSIPGLGRILLTSISNRDYPVVEAVIIWVAFLVLFVNLLVDLLYRFLDPRITLE